MSHARGADQPPDLSEAVLGYRIWQLGIKGTLGAIVAGSIWKPGPNKAVCCPSFAPSSRPVHRSPNPGCICGFNAYASLVRELRPYGGTVLGAIAAWGEVDVYQTGFRAEYAQVVALALPATRRHVPASHRERLALAAQRYSVALVPRERLEVEASQHASPIPPSLLPSARRQPTPKVALAPASKQRGPQSGRSSAPTGAPRIATWDDARGRAIWVRRHVAVRCRKDAVELGPAPGAAALLGPDPRVWSLAVGARVEAGDVVATIEAAYPGRRIHVLSPIGGTVKALNASFAVGLLDGDRSVSAAPWLVDLRPDASAPLEDSPLLWGRPGVELYRQGVIRQSDASVFAELAAPLGYAPGALRSLAQTPQRVAHRIPLAAHQRERTSLPPEKGRRAAIMVEHLRPLLYAVGGSGQDDLLAA